MQPSPYRPGELAEEVPGRELQMGDARERLSLMADLGRLMGRIQIYTAPRGFGKTSLLSEIERVARAQGAAVAWVTAGERHGLVPAVVEELRNAASGWSSGVSGRLARAFEHATVSLNLGVASVETSWAAGEHDEARSRQGARGFQDLLEASVEDFRDHGQRALAIVVDEIQAADPEGLRTLAYTWQHLQREARDLPIGVFAAGLPSTPATIAAAVTFSKRFAYYDLEPLSPRAAIEALATPARRAGVIWEPAALEIAVAAAEGYPFAVQLVGDHAWRLAGLPDAGGVIATATGEQAAQLMYGDLDRMARERWLTARPAEQAFLAAMASLGNGPVQRSDVATVLGTESRSLSETRERLLSKGLVVAPGHGQLTFALPRMGDYIRRASESSRPPGRQER